MRSVSFDGGTSPLGTDNRNCHDVLESVDERDLAEDFNPEDASLPPLLKTVISYNFSLSIILPARFPSRSRVIGLLLKDSTRDWLQCFNVSTKEHNCSCVKNGRGKFN